MERRRNFELMLSSMTAFVLSTLNTAYATATLMTHQPSPAHLGLLIATVIGIVVGILYCVWSVVQHMLGHQLGTGHVWPVRLTLALVVGLGAGAGIGIAGITGN